MYEELLEIAKKYLGVFGKIVILEILENEKIDKDHIQEKDLEVIANSFAEKAHRHGLAPEVYDEPIKRDILAIK